MKIKDLLASSITLIFPASCPVCWSAQLQYPDLICTECNKNIKNEFDLVFRKTPSIVQILSCSRYIKHIKEAIKLFKYEQEHIIHIFDPLIRNAFKIRSDLFRNIDIIIPVPLHKKRYRKRSFNQSKIIAEELSGFSKILLLDNLIKIKNTISQTGLSRTERMENLKNSFRIKDPYMIKGKSILLVDDIITTGATLETCAKELLNAGVKEVKGFTLASTP